MLGPVLELLVVKVDARIQDIDIHILAIPDWLVRPVKRELKLVQPVQVPWEIGILVPKGSIFFLNVCHAFQSANLQNAGNNVISQPVS